MYEEVYDSDDLPYSEVTDFGVFHLDVDEAAELVARTLYLDGMLDASAQQKDGGYSLYDSELSAALEDHINQFRDLLCSGINKGTLEAVRLYRDFQEYRYKSDLK